MANELERPRDPGDPGALSGRAVGEV